MKKIVLSGSVIFVFILYILSVNKQNVELLPIQTGNPTTVPLTNAPTAIPTPIDTNGPTTTVALTPVATANNGKYKDGSYTGSTEDAFYGNVQVKAIITNGMITDVQFLQYPNDRRTSVEINTQAMPLLKQEAITAQSANVDGVSGASATSPAFVRSLQNALDQAAK